MSFIIRENNGSNSPFVFSGTGSNILSVGNGGLTVRPVITGDSATFLNSAGYGVLSVGNTVVTVGAGYALSVGYIVPSSTPRVYIQGAVTIGSNVAGGAHTHLVVTGVGQNGLTIQNNERTIDFLQVQNNGDVILSASHSVSGTYSVATKQYVDSKVVAGSSGSSGTSGVAGSSGTSGTSGSSGTSANIVIGGTPPTSGDVNVAGKYTNNDTRYVLGEPDTWIQITIGDDVYNVPGYRAS